MSVQKWQACGNDFIVTESKVYRPFSAVAIKVCDRHYGIGADGVLRIDESEIADCKMMVINKNGSEAEMCGNGIRCVAQYMSNKLGKDLIRIETRVGVKEVKILNPYERIAVDMGKATLKWSHPLELPGRMYSKPKVFERANYVDIGNPHCVLLVENDETDGGVVARYGRKINSMRNIFPNGTNVEFVYLLGGNEIRVKVWERGVGRTLACGTGACASAYAVYKAKLLGDETDIRIKLDGGYITTHVSDENIELIGPARYVCSAEYALEEESKRNK